MDGLHVYASGFETTKASRTLKWMTGVGCIQMDVELDGTSISVNVSPAHAAVLAAFLEKGTFSM